MYVVYYCERMRDGREDGAKVVETIEQAEALITRMRNGFAGDNMEFGLYELGEEIPLTTTAIEEPQPSKKTHKVSAKPKRKRGK